MYSVLSFDISTKGTGWCYYEHPGKFKMGVIRFDPKWDMPKRMTHLFEESGLLIEEFNPTVVLVEGVFAFRNVKVAKILSEAGGMVKINCYRKNIPVEVIENTTVKSYFKSKKKEDLFETVCILTDLHLLDIDFKTFNDMIDSFALLLYYLSHVSKKLIIKDEGTLNFFGAEYGN